MYQQDIPVPFPFATFPELPKRRFVRLLLVQGPTASGDLADTWKLGEVIVIGRNPNKNDDHEIDVYILYIYIYDVYIYIYVYV